MLAKLSHSLIALGCLFISSTKANLLTNQQINLLLENDDVQVFTPHSKVKKVTLSIAKSTDHSQGKTIAEYTKDGLLINYYQVSVIKDEKNNLSHNQNTMITTLINIADGQWQRKQTLNTLEIDNSVYTLKNDHINMVMVSDGMAYEQNMAQHIFPLNKHSGVWVNFSYMFFPKNEQLNIDYQFDQNSQLSHYQYFITDEYGNRTKVKLNFQYDQQQRLIQCNEEDDYQTMNKPAEKIFSHFNYYDFDRLGNWQTKIEKMHSQTVIYSRTIEYW